MQDSFDDLGHFEAVLTSQGLSGALAFLNRRAPHRYTAVYQLAGDKMLNLAIYDRLGELVSPLPPTPNGNSFCQHVLPGQAFISENVLNDPRLTTHFQRGVINSYVGLPLSRGPLHLYGTLCQMDPGAQQLSEGQYLFLQQVAPLLLAYLDTDIERAPAPASPR